MKNIGDIYLVSSATTIRITNKEHLHSANSSKDTLCSKNFVFPNVGNEIITYSNGNIYKNGIEIDRKFVCDKCLNIFIKKNKS